MIAAEGYPEHPVKGDKIKINEPERTGFTRPGAPDPPGGQAYLLHAGTAHRHAGTAAAGGPRRSGRRRSGSLVSAGGRVLNAVGSGPDIAAARAAAYALAATIELRGGWYRHDIAARL